MANVKKNDYVMIIAGKDKGKTAQIIGVDTKSQRVLVEGKDLLTVNKKAVKARKATDKGGIIAQPATVDISNVMPICAGCGKPTRVGNKVVDGKKVRICKECGSVLETKKASEKKTKSEAKATVRKRTKKAETATETVSEIVKPATSAAETPVTVLETEAPVETKTEE